MTGNILKMLFFVSLLVSQSLLALPVRQELSIEEPACGYIHIEYMNGKGKFVPAGKLSFKKYVHSRKITIPDAGSLGKLTLRLTPVGGHSFLDYISVDGMPFNTRKLCKKDDDLIALDKREIFVFEQNKKTEKYTIELAARITPEVVIGESFKYPLINTHKKMNIDSDFYTYALNSRVKKLKIDGNVDSALGSPFFSEYYPVGSGHPQGTTYGWVHNDTKNLYVTIDFTADNTMDGLEDNAEVFIKDGDKVKSYMINTGQTKWGSVGFTYTDRVAYQHKLYEFKIPLSEFSSIKKDELQIAFSAYGTAAAAKEGKHVPVLAYNSTDKNILMIYTDNHDEDNSSDSSYYGNIKGMLLSPSGVRKSGIFEIVSEKMNVYDLSYIHYKLLYIADKNKYFFAYANENKLIGLLLNADGTPDGDAIEISDNIYLSAEIRLAYNSVSKQLLVSWLTSDNKYIQYRFIDEINNPGEIVTIQEATRHFDIVWNSDFGDFLLVNGIQNSSYPYYSNIYTRIVDSNGIKEKVKLEDVFISGFNGKKLKLVYNTALKKYQIACEGRDGNLQYVLLDSSGSIEGGPVDLFSGIAVWNCFAAYNNYLEKTLFSAVWRDTLENTQLKLSYVDNSGTVEPEFSINGYAQYKYNYDILYNPYYENMMVAVADSTESRIDIYSYPETVFNIPELEYPLDSPEGLNMSNLSSDKKIVFNVTYYGESAPMLKQLQITEPEKSEFDPLFDINMNLLIHGLIILIMFMVFLRIIFQKNKKLSRNFAAGLSVAALIILLYTCGSSGGRSETDNNDPGSSDNLEDSNTEDNEDEPVVKNYTMVESDSDDIVYKDGKDYYCELEITEKGVYSYRFMFKDSEGDAVMSDIQSFELK